MTDRFRDPIVRALDRIRGRLPHRHRIIKTVGHIPILHQRLVECVIVIKERMTAARLGYRTNQREEIESLKRALEAANRRIAELEAKLKESR